MNCLRNWEQRQQLKAQIESMEQKMAAAYDAIQDDLSDEDFCAAAEEIDKAFDTTMLRRKMVALEYKESKSDWFKGFAQSFGICENKRITRKQAEVFAKYSEPRHEWSPGRGMRYFVRVGNLFVETILFGEHEPGYVTIREI